MASWLEEALASLQNGGAPQVGALSGSPFPDAPAPVDEGAMAAAAREAAGQRMMAANQRRINPFAFPNAESGGIQLAMGNAPEGTGVPGPTNFAMGVPPSMQLASSMTQPPQQAPQQPQVPPMAPPQEVVPLPVPRPAEADAGGTDVSAARRAPMGMVAAQPTVTAPGAEPGMFDSFASFNKGMKELSPKVIALGAGLAGDGWNQAQAVISSENKLAQQNQQMNLTSQALLARGAPAAEVAAAVRNPDLMKALVGRYFETKAPMVVNGKVVRENPDGSIRTLADFSKEEKAKNPVVKDFTNPDGSSVAKQWNAETETWDAIPGFEKSAPKDKDRRLSVTDIGKLSEEGGKLNQINTFQQTWKPEFGGWKSNSIGELANLAGRNLPESIAGKNAGESAAWWQDYDRYKNMVRHELFGSALTAGESKAFMQADIGPGMTPQQIERNLATQKRVVESAIRRKGKGLIGSTYDRGAIASAYGVEPDFFDREDTPAPKAAASGKTSNGISWSVN